MRLELEKEYYSGKMNPDRYKTLVGSVNDREYQIDKDISINNKIDLVLNEDQYFISSENNDISQLVLHKLNDKKLNLQILDE